MPDTAFDPWWYKGPVTRADGNRPYNGHLWPTECWAFSHDHPHPHVCYSMRIEVIALADGRFATNGSARGIEAGIDCYGQPCVWPTRAQAIRVSAARMIRLCRRAVRGRWKVIGLHRAPEIITWARALVARETGGPEPRPLTFTPPAPPRVPTGLPLFDLETSHG